MGYSIEDTHRITFEEWDEPDLWVELKTISEMLYDEYLEVWVNKIPDEVNPIVRQIAAMVVDWNLTDKEGNILPIPSTDPGSVAKVRTRHAEYIGQTILADSLIMDELNLPGRMRKS